MERRYFTRSLGLLGLLALPMVSIKAETATPLIYKARLSQFNTDAPTAEVLCNTLNTEVTWLHWDSGTYIGSFATPFDSSAKVFCYSPVRDNAGDVTTGMASNFTMDGDNGSVMFCAYGEGEDGLIGRREVEGVVFVAFEIYLN